MSQQEGINDQSTGQPDAAHEAATKQKEEPQPRVRSSRRQDVSEYNQRKSAISQPLPAKPGKLEGWKPEPPSWVSEDK
jgi:hypothetical protein